ncbi:DNA polymerase Y family protein [Xanthobacter sp. 126]|uniref:Y-family DNA polymerase n=1 Tax=Xanthobacter sp. 126 TaxID=1131814 RepID=UPI00045E7F8F|nr:DNA polymerase Y family protein [Xanthobacter sp. 126]
MPDASPRRLAALFLPRLPTDRLHRSRRGRRMSSAGDAPADPPLVTVEVKANARRLAAVDAAAARLGLHPGLTLADAQARVPKIEAVEADAAADTALLAAIASWCERWTPFVAVSGPDGIVLDITGCAHLFGGEAALLSAMTERLAATELAACGAVAGTARAALALARWRPGRVVPAGGEREAVAPLPVEALGLNAEAARSLSYLGLVRIGDIAGKPRAALAARFGSTLVERLDELCGAASPPISPLNPLPVYVAERRFAEPMGDEATARAVLADLARDLTGVLERHGEGGRRFEAAFFRSDGAVRRVAAGTAAPLRDDARLAALFRERLAALADPLDPGFGYDVIRLSVTAAEPLTATQSGFDAEPDGAGLDQLVDILSARLGPRRVTCLAALDSHIPERAAVRMPAQKAWRSREARAQTSLAHDWVEPTAAGAPLARPPALFPAPEPVETLAEVPDGPPLRFRWRRVLHEVARAEGPERIAPEWWTALDGNRPGLTRDYFRVEDTEGRRFWLYREGTYGGETSAPRWFLHGLFP